LEFDTLCDATVPNYVFTGTMDYAPNVEAVSWFAKSILPSIRVRQPHAQFHIVGANPTPQVIALASAPGVHVTGRVADVRPYLAYATAAVVPMKIARGIQNKVLEAMAMARPVVVTSDALEGVEAVPGTEVLLANGADEFASMCLLAIEPASDAIGRAARRRVLADYDWNNRLHALDALLQPQGVATTAI
jgi:glycosyltransferase involved in cell wall biosynthesis